MLKINKKLIKSTLKLNKSYFCFVSKVLKSSFYFNTLYCYYYKYNNIYFFNIESFFFQILKLLYFLIDLIRVNGIFLVFFQKILLKKIQGNTKYSHNNILCVLSKWLGGSFSNKEIIFWKYLKYNLEVILEKPTLAIFFNINRKNNDIVLELASKNVPIISAVKGINNNNFVHKIDYPVIINNSLYSLYFFSCLLLKLLWIR